MGGIHGDEMSSVGIVYDWMRRLDAENARPFDWRVIFCLNPDGMLARRPTRMNAHGVDLNRNFPTPGWSQDAKVYWARKTRSDPRRFPGTAPLSEPESRWLHEEIKRFKPDVIQAPTSLLDQRLLIDGTLSTLAEMGIEVQLRSIFLNGLLFLPPDRAPSHLKAAAGRISRARRLIAEGRSDPLQAALGFALSRPEASSVLVGVASVAEMSAVIAAASSPPPDLDWDEMALDDPVALDPTAWAAA